MLRSKEDSPPQATPSKVFLGVRFVLLGFDSVEQPKVRAKLLNGGGVDVGEYGPRCTHLIVDRIVDDDSECAVARGDGKTVITALWVDHCVEVGMLVDSSSVLYRPVKDLNGIPGAKSLSICLTGYQRQDRDDIMKMVGLMGAHFSKPLVANKVTHLICYKFEGEKYELAKKLKKIKLVNHRWLEDCLRAWEILPEGNYNKSGHELEIMEAEAKDSEEETEENKSNRLLEENVSDKGLNMHLHGENSAGILKGSKMPMATNQNEASKEVVSGRIEVNTNENGLVSNLGGEAKFSNIPELHEIYRNGRESTCQGTVANDEANAIKESCDFLSKPIMASRTPHADAAAPGVLSYSRKTQGRSPASELSGMFSSHVRGSPHGDLEQCKVKDFEVSSAHLDELKSDLDPGKNQNFRNDSDLHLEKSHNLPLKRKSSLSNASSRSPSRVGSNTRNRDTGRSSASARTEGLLIDRPHIESSSCDGNGGNCFEKNEVRKSAIDQSPKTKSLKVGGKALNHELPLSEITMSDGPILSDFKILERTPKASGLGLEQSKFTNANIGNDISRLTDFQFDEKSDHSEELQNGMALSLKSGKDETQKCKSPLGLAMHNGSKDDAFSRPLSKKKTGKKKLSSKSKVSPGSNKQKGSLCLNEKNIQVEAMSPTEESKQPVNEGTIAVIGEMSGPESKTETIVEKNLDFSSENKVESAAATEDDETEAPDEDIGTKLENEARGKMTYSIPQENAATEKKLEAAQCSATEIKSDFAHSENETATLEKDGEDVEHDKCKSDLVGGLRLKGETVKGRMKRKKNASSVVKNIERSGNDNEIELEKIVDDEKMQAKKTNEMQRPVSKLKCRPESLDNEADSVNAKKDTKPTENRELIRGRKIKGENSLQADAKNSRTTGEDKKVANDKKVVNGTNDGNMDLQKAKDVQGLPIKSESRTRKKDQKYREEEEKENKPIETGAVSAKSGKHKRGTVASKLNRAPAQINKNLSATNLDGMLPHGGSKLVRHEPVSYILSGHRLQRKEFQQIIKSLRGRVCRDSHNWSYQATHFIVPDPIRRTEKFFAAAASGRWILKTDYLTASNQAGILLPEEPYEWFKKGFSEDGAINLEAPRKWRLLRERTGHGAFYGMRIIIYGECIAPPLDTLKRVVKAGDGVILATSPPYTRYLNSGVDFAVVRPGTPCVDPLVQEFLRHEIPCIVADYLVDYVCKPGCSLERHVLYKTDAWAEKSFANLLSRSEEVVEDDCSPLEDDGSTDIPCQVCGSRDRAEVMLICGDETGSLGCGVGTHIDCCDPPLEAVPKEDWFCSKCSEAQNRNHPTKKTKKGSSSSRRK